MARFLSIYTPTYKRPTLLAACIQSVNDQTIRGEIEHVIMVDEVGVGIAGMFAEIPNHLERLTGEYVYVLQDDDVLAGPDVVERLRAFVRVKRAPGVVIVRNRKRDSVYPTYWGERPRRNHIDLGNYVIRQDVFAQHVTDFGQRYDGDFDFIDAVWQAGWPFGWCDLLFAEALGTGLGRQEGEIEFALKRALERSVNPRQRVVT